MLFWAGWRIPGFRISKGFKVGGWRFRALRSEMFRVWVFVLECLISGLGLRVPSAAVQH